MALHVERTVRGTWHLICRHCGVHTEAANAEEARQWEVDHNEGAVYDKDGNRNTQGIPVTNDSGEVTGYQPRHPSEVGDKATSSVDAA